MHYMITLTTLKHNITRYKLKNKISTYIPGKRITSKNGFKYILNAKYAKVDKRMKRAIPPSKMLVSGIFSGKYINDDVMEFPVEWYIRAIKKGKLSPHKKNPLINKYRLKSRMSLKYWKKNGWIHGKDQKGWFQWWCRYYIGLRRPFIDEIQIRRWLSYKRHWSQLRKNLKNNNKWKDPSYRPKQRQSLLQWAWTQPDSI